MCKYVSFRAGEPFSLFSSTQTGMNSFVGSNVQKQGDNQYTKLIFQHLQTAELHNNLQ